MKTLTESRLQTIPKTTQDKSANSLIGRLRNSELFRSYREIFRNSMGLPLDLRAVGSQRLESVSDDAGGSSFCRILNDGTDRCRWCSETQCGLSSHEGRGVRSIRCFAGLTETAVSVMHGGAVVGQLMTGHVFHEAPTGKDFAEVLRTVGGDADRDAKLQQAYLGTPVIGKEKYRAMTTLLAAFSLQLGELAGQIVLELRHEKSDCIACAKDYIDENIHEPIVLDEVAGEVHMSRYYLCRRFKEATGMTLTEYVTDRRVKMAMEMLANTSLRVADIAFEVGFQSLSQFNRCFHKITRITPTEYRRSESESRSPVGKKVTRGSGNYRVESFRQSNLMAS
jgi:AraC-like DNA-binding protein/ligand-binding sensor protein